MTLCRSGLIFNYVPLQSNVRPAKLASTPSTMAACLSLQQDDWLHRQLDSFALKFHQVPAAYDRSLASKPSMPAA